MKKGELRRKKDWGAIAISKGTKMLEHPPTKRNKGAFARGVRNEGRYKTRLPNKKKTHRKTRKDGLKKKSTRDCKTKR